MYLLTGGLSSLKEGKKMFFCSNFSGKSPEKLLLAGQTTDKQLPRNQLLN